MQQSGGEARRDRVSRDANMPKRVHHLSLVFAKHGGAAGVFGDGSPLIILSELKSADQTSLQNSEDCFGQTL